jgi:hypothetical protein
MDAPAQQDPDVGSLTGRAERSISSPPAPTSTPTFRCPVDPSWIDLDEAISIARDAIAAAAHVIGNLDNYVLGQLVEQVVRRVHNGQVAEQGLCATSVAADARVGTGHLPDHFKPEVEAVADLAVRLILLSGGGRVLHEEIFSVAALGRRTQNGFGHYQIKNAPSSIHFAGNAIGASDRNSVTWATPLVTDTPWDRSAEIADAQQIADAEKARGRPVPASPAEQVTEILDFQRRQRERVHDRAAEFAEALSQIGVSPRTADFGRAFAQPLILRGLPVGPPTRRGERSARTILPGEDAAIISALRQARRPAIAFAGPVPGDLDLASAGYSPLRWNVGDLAQPLGVQTDAPYGTELLWSGADQTVVRRVVGDGAYARKWKVVGFTEDDLPNAIALMERATFDWPQGCILRATKWCAPGLLQVSTLPAYNTWRALCRIADAALVQAERHERARRAAG